jgi:3-hydroxybutyryl-CoA dehydratase
MMVVKMNEKISEYFFDEINVGMKKQFNKIISESMVNDFAKLSGDYNPLHVNEEYARKTNFKKRVCHGMLLTSFFSRLIGMYLPGKQALLFSQSLNFVNPCFIDDKITIYGEIISKNESTKTITVNTNITNQEKKKIVHGEIRVLLRDD